MTAHLLPSIQRRNPELDFQLLKQVGSGTYGEVYKAKIVKTGQLSALKIIKIEAGEDFNIIQQEIAILADCKHANIVGYFGSYLRGDKLWIAMEFCGGGSLQDIYHATGGLNELQIAFVCRETLKGLNYLHEKGKIHRDIKGANILLTDDGDVKLADFGIAAQITATLAKRNSFIGTPYWMAPEVAAVEKKGGYNQQCDVWAVGITAIELAEMQPPMFDLHPMRALYLMTKRNFKSPTLKHKNKWSENFHDFLRTALQKDPLKRPTAQRLLKHEFVDRELLTNVLMISLIKELSAPVKVKKKLSSDDLEDREEEELMEQNKDAFRRVSSQHRENPRNPHEKDSVTGQGMNLTPPSITTENAQPLPAWLQSSANAQAPKPQIKRISSVPVVNDNDFKSPNSTAREDDDIYSTPDEPSSGRTVPPLPPRSTNRMKSENGSAAEDAGLYDTVPDDMTPVVPPKPQPSARSSVLPLAGGPPPALPPKSAPQVKKATTDPKAYFSKIFNGCPLHFNCAMVWMHPTTKVSYGFLGAEEGLYSLELSKNSDPIMEQVYPRTCHWIYIFNNSLVSIMGRSRHLCMTNLILLHDKDKQSHVLRNRDHTTKIGDSKGCMKCCVGRNPYTGEQYLIAAIPRGIMLLQWFQPRHIFMMVKVYETNLPNPLNTFEAMVQEGDEYPCVCVGVRQGDNGGVKFEIVNLNSRAQWYADENLGEPLNVVSLNQVEKDTVMIGYDKYCKFVDRSGVLKPSSRQASQLIFDYKAEALVRLQDCVLNFNRHGMQGKSLITQQVTAEVTDKSKVFHLLGSVGNVLIETHMLDDPSGPSNLYILVSDKN